MFGGAGYTRDYPVERFYRDNRLNHIHEGTRGILGLDLLGRKVPMRDGASFKALMAEIAATTAAVEQQPELAEFSEALRLAASRAADTTVSMGAKAV